MRTKIHLYNLHYSRLDIQCANYQRRREPVIMKFLKFLILVTTTKNVSKTRNSFKFAHTRACSARAGRLASFSRDTHVGVRDNLLITRISAPFSSFNLWLSSRRSLICWKKYREPCKLQCQQQQNQKQHRLKQVVDFTALIQVCHQVASSLLASSSLCKLDLIQLDIFRLGASCENNWHLLVDERFWQSTCMKTVDNLKTCWQLVK